MELSDDGPEEQLIDSDPFPEVLAVERNNFPGVETLEDESDNEDEDTDFSTIPDSTEHSDGEFTKIAISIAKAKETAPKTLAGANRSGSACCLLL